MRIVKSESETYVPYHVLSRVNYPGDIKRLSMTELKHLAMDIRNIIKTVVSDHGGHLSSNLGTVELTIALHRVFDAPRDKIVWDTGHQAYAHKILTGRKEKMLSIRKKNGIYGFPKREESEYDTFDVGHAGTALSAAAGMALARDLKGENYEIIAVVGDGALTEGVSLEAANYILATGMNMIVVLNDNGHSIGENVGFISQFFRKLWPMKYMSSLSGEVKSYTFMNSRYYGPVDGHDLEMLIKTFEAVKKDTGLRLVHVVTTKGKGVEFAEEDPEFWHSAPPFDVETGTPRKNGKRTFSKAFGEALDDLMKRDNKIIAFSAAMLLGTGMKPLVSRYPGRVLDVAIAEQHAVNMAAGAAVNGLRPVVAIYSTFLQRAYDQIWDVAMQKLNVTYALDRAGVVPGDGPTHQGIFDLAYMSIFPNMVVMAPRDEYELRNMLYTAIYYDGPASIRYPKAAVPSVPGNREFRELEIGKGELLMDGSDAAIIAIGSMVYPALEAAKMLGNEGYTIAVVDARFRKPLDGDLIRSVSRDIPVLTVEEGTLEGGLGWAVQVALGRKVSMMGIPDEFPDLGTREELLEEYSLTPSGIAKEVKKLL